MFQRRKSSQLTPADAAEQFRRDLNIAIEKAEAAHAGKSAIVATMLRAIEAARYSEIVGKPHPAYTSVTICAPPRPSRPVGALRAILRGA